MLDPNLMSFVLGSLPPPPANVLEVGAGEGELAGALASAGYEVVAIDPESKSDAVRPIRLHELDAASSFDAAVAVLSMHHVEPLDESCQRLAGAGTRPLWALRREVLQPSRRDRGARHVNEHGRIRGAGLAE